MCALIQCFSIVLNRKDILKSQFCRRDLDISAPCQIWRPVNKSDLSVHQVKGGKDISMLWLYCSMIHDERTFGLPEQSQFCYPYRFVGPITSGLKTRGQKKYLRILPSLGFLLTNIPFFYCFFKLLAVILQTFKLVIYHPGVARNNCK